MTSSVKAYCQQCGWTGVHAPPNCNTPTCPHKRPAATHTYVCGMCQHVAMGGPPVCLSTSCPGFQSSTSKDAGNTHTLLDKRATTHGDYGDMADTMAALTECMAPTLQKLDPRLRFPVQMICMKLARIKAGDPEHLDHWRDIAGYAELAVQDIERRKRLAAENV